MDCLGGGDGARSQTWTFHWERRSRGIASIGDWAVTAMNCSRTARCESDSCAISTELGESDMAADRWWWWGGGGFRLSDWGGGEDPSCSSLDDVYIICMYRGEGSGEGG